MMRILPILMNDDMALAAHEGRKTQTRRLPREQPPEGFRLARAAPDRWHKCRCPAPCAEFQREVDMELLVSPYAPGDLLYVREAFRAWCTVGSGDLIRVEYRADGCHQDMMVGSDLAAEEVDQSLRAVRHPGGDRWRPNIHMPRWAARTWLRVTDVRIERVQDITEEDARAEGVEPYRDMAFLHGDPGGRESYRDGFIDLWDSLYARRGLGWTANPWVWVVAFKRAERPEGER